MNERFWSKANALAEAWGARYGHQPSVHAVVLVMSVAEHETNLGDAWQHSGNWGAIQRRIMSSEERAQAGAGMTPKPRDPFEELHGDSSPIHGHYQTWFWKFPAGVQTARGQSGDVAGADKLLEVLLEQRASIKAGIESMTPYQLAEAMYRTHYYEGFHDPRVEGGAAANIADYARALTSLSATIGKALDGWTPGAEPTTAPAPYIEPASFDLFTTLGVQQALNRLAPAAPQLKEDGIKGPRTLAAILAFQVAHGLDADGKVGPKTRKALSDALA